MAKLFSFGLNILADIFYPKYCFSCKRSGGYLCKFCVNQIPILQQSFCIVCNKASVDGWTHLQCKQAANLNINLTPSRLISKLSYKNPIVTDMIITGKYYFIPEIFAVLTALVSHNLLLKGFEEEITNFVICPIPLHSKRHRWRGFNQSEIISNIFSQAFHIPTKYLLVRQIQTKTQKDLDAATREQNMKNAFIVSQPYNKNLPKNILLVDDVTTTGQTFLEATRALKLAGARTVWCISLAKD
jgi:ComF family protein